MNEADRVAFEEWAKTEYIDLTRFASGFYAYDAAAHAQQGWQAATARQSERVKELEEALMKIADYGEDWTHAGLMEIARAALEKKE